MILGNERFKVFGDNYSRFYREIYNKRIPCNNMYEEKDYLFFEISIEYSKDVIDIIEDLKFEYEIINKRGVFFKGLRVLNHKGLVFGGIISIFACVFFSNFVLKFNILSDDKEAKNQIMSVLEENNVKAGSYIPNLNLVELERELKQNVKNISWAGISVKGGVLTIDTIENIPSPNGRKIRLPCNLVAKYNGVVDKVEVYEGQLKTRVGSGVSKGDVLVSGTLEREDITYDDGKEIKDITTKYVRSFGHIYADFEETVVINQPFEEQEEIIDDKTIRKRYFKFFDLKVPLFFSMPDGKFISRDEYNGFEIFDNEIPLGIEILNLNEYTYKTNKISKKEAKRIANEKLKKYEKNNFKDYKIKDVKIKENTTKNGFKITATYKLYGDIAEESEFFVKK